MANPWQELNSNLATVAERAQRSLVQISNGRQGHGAGTIWHPSGLIVTNAHVVRSRQLEVTLSDGRSLPATVLARNPDQDLAALSVDASELPTIELGDSRHLRPGEWVLALGHPWGVTGAVTAGVVTGVGAQLPEMPLAEREWIVASLHLRPGHSGGPLVDTAGRLLGINTLMVGPEVGLAVPAHVIESFLSQMA